MTLTAKSITLLSIKISYFEAGQGPVMLFLHNSGGTWQIWQKQLDFFSKTHRVIALNWPGSIYSEEYPKESTLENFSHLLALFVETLQLKRLTLVGNCIGAAIAIDYAQKHPQQVEQLFLFNICPGKRLVKGSLGKALLGIWENLAWTRAIANPFLHFFRDQTLWAKRFPAMLFGNNISTSDALYQALDENLKKQKYLKDRFKDLFALNSYSLERYYKAPLAVPVKLFWGTKNKVTALEKDGHFFALMLQIPIIPINGGHLCMYECAEEVNQQMT